MAKKILMVTCRYKNCKHESKQLPKDEAFCNGNAYYHKDCWEEKLRIVEEEKKAKEEKKKEREEKKKEKQKIEAEKKTENNKRRKKTEDRKEIIDLYFRNVDSHPMYTVLQRDINYLLDKCNCPSDYLLFAARYAIDRGWWKHEHGIMYIARNDEIKEAYKKHLDRKVQTEQHSEVTDEQNKGTVFNYKPQRKKSISDLVSNLKTVTK